MTIRIVTDSTCDLPKWLVEKHGITIIPLFINIGSQGYLDGVDLTREEFYRRLPTSNPPPTTATPAPQAFQQVYEGLANEGATQILSIHISISLSATINTARLGAQATKAAPVTVFDSRQLSLGTGFLVLTAAKAAAEGRSLDEIIELMEDQIMRTHVFAMVDTLEFLRRSGRMNWAAAGLGSLLEIKPLLKMYDGNPTSERIRTRNRAMERVITLLSEQAPFEQVAIVHAHAPESAEDLRQQARHLLPEGDILSMDITPVIGSHIGPGAVGFACVTAAGK